MFDSCDDILTVEETADALKTGVTQIYKILRSGQLKGYKEGKDWKIPKVSLESYIREKINLS